MIRRFEVQMTVTVGIELDERVIDQVDDDWRKTFYSDIRTPANVAEHVAYNVVANHLEIDQIDGFANLPRDTCKASVRYDDIEAREVEQAKPKPKAKAKGKRR